LEFWIRCAAEWISKLLSVVVSAVKIALFPANPEMSVSGVLDFRSATYDTVVTAEHPRDAFCFFPKMTSCDALC
jgi:hypothetical protein